MIATSSNQGHHAMSETVQPDWMQGFVPNPQRGNPKWRKGMESPCKSGRPPGIVDRRMKVTKALMDDAPAVARVVIDAALAGDMQAANILMSRVAPPIKVQAERVEFELSPDAPLAAQAQQIVAAIAAGKVDPDTGRTLIASLHAVADIRATEELEHRIIMLEAKQV
ncbi:hypothetical protein [Sphingobium sp. Z007]|uniref:hypothetical protein n=1 Tax=Sphingobium sp. Z007 TaxID=627495 RepID=UPI001C3DFAD9|nr:hypothetical protein [Sphingobium sp. Z007]